MCLVYSLLIQLPSYLVYGLCIYFHFCLPKCLFPSPFEHTTLVVTGRFIAGWAFANGAIQELINFLFIRKFYWRGIKTREYCRCYNYSGDSLSVQIIISLWTWYFILRWWFVSLKKKIWKCRCVDSNFSVPVLLLHDFPDQLSCDVCLYILDSWWYS